MKIDELIEELEQVKEEHGNLELTKLKTLEDFTLGKKFWSILTKRQTFHLKKEDL